MTLRGYKILASMWCMLVHLPMHAAETTLDTQHLHFRWANIMIHVKGIGAHTNQVGIVIQPKQSLSAADIFQRVLRLINQKTNIAYSGRLFSNGCIIDTLSWDELAGNPIIILEFCEQRLLNHSEA